MLLLKNQTVIAKEGVNTFENEKYKVFWEGCLFIKGSLSGLDSIKLFVEEIERVGIKKSCCILWGSFSCFVYDRNKNIYYAFVDNGRGSPLFYADSLISTSFLSLLNHSNLKIKDISPFNIVEFVLTGLVFTEEIFSEKIKIIKTDEIIVSSSSGITIEHKEIKDIFSLESPKTTVQMFLDVFQNIVFSLKNNRISVDLTGGTDTRLLFSILKHYGMKFETAVSGTPGHSDINISLEVAQKMGLKHYVTYHTVKNIDLEEEMENVFKACDGLSNILDYHRLYQFEQQRKKRDINLAIGGSGGELYKDGGWWRTAFSTGPGHQKNKATIKKLVNSGLASWGSSPIPPHKLFSEKYHKISLNYKNYLLGFLTKKFNEANKYRTADKNFYEYSVISPRGSGHRIINHYHPLLDWQIVILGINLPWRKRFFHNFYREIITSINPEVARLTTDRGGMTTSTEFIPFLKELKNLQFYYLKKIKIKKSVKIPSTNPELYSKTRKTKEIKKIIKLLKTHEILHSDIDLNDINNRYLGRLLTLGKVLKRL